MQHHAETRMYLSHTQDKKKNPLNYEQKLHYCELAFGDVMKPSDAKTIIDAFKEVYADGFNEVIYVGGEDRIGGDEDVSSMIMKYNGVPNKKGEISYDFGMIRFVNAGHRDDNSNDPIEKASASLVRQLAAEGKFDEFKKFVPLDENEAKNMYNDVRKGLGLEIEEELINEEPIGVPATGKSAYIKLKPEFDKELNKIGLKAPDPNKGIDDYKLDPEDYQGLFVKQNSDKKLSFSAKDLNKISNEDPHIPDDAVQQVNNLVITDGKGNKYAIHKSELSADTNSKSKFSDQEITYYQEAIYCLLLTDKIKEAHSDTFKEWLLKSDPKTNSNIFNYIIPLNIKEGLFKNNWESFINDWYNAFVIISNSREEFVTNANAVLSSDVSNAVILHSGIKNNYAQIASKLLSGADTYDKSDAYFCVGNVDEITKKMSELRTNKIEYVKFMSDNSDKIIGVSLKRPTGKTIQVHWDIPSKNNDYFKNEVYWKGADGGKTQTIYFNSEDGTIQLVIRSNKEGGTGTLEWKSKSAKAQMGKAKTALMAVLENNQALADSILSPLGSKVRDFEKAAYNMMVLLTDKNTIVKDKIYDMSIRGKTIITQIFNLSCGFAATDPEGNRITTPYLKVM